MPGSPRVGGEQYAPKVLLRGGCPGKEVRLGRCEALNGLIAEGSINGVPVLTTVG